MHAAFVLSVLASVATAAPMTSLNAINLARSIVARAPEGANPVLRSVTSTGTGCAGNSAGFVYENNAAVVFDAMVVHTDDPSEASKNCKLTIDIGLDSKWKYTVNREAIIRGYTDDLAATFKVVYTAGGKSATAQTTIPQPPTGGVAYSVNMKQPDEKGVSSPYGGGVTIIDFTVTLFNRKPGTPGYLSVDSMDVIFDYEQ